MKPDRTLTLALLGLAAITAVACGPRTSDPDPAAVAGSFTPAEAPLPDLVTDVGRLDRSSNPARLEALLEILRERGLEFEVRPFQNPWRDRDPREEGRNVVVTVGSGTERTIIVGAHYDAVRLPDGSLSDGAVDNGAGTVVLTRVAETLNRQRLRHRVLVVFFDLEEIGLVGSSQFARTADTTALAAMVNVDVAAYGDAVMFGPASHEGNGSVYAAMHRVCGRWRLTCLEFPNYPPSDDRSFQALGVANISIGTLTRPEAYQVWLLLNAGPDAGLEEGFTPPIFRTIHTRDDRLERVDATAMTLVYNAVVGLVLELDRSLH